MKNHAAIILHQGEKILFVQRAATKKSLPNIWAFPSGTIEEGESPEVTALREAKEELGIDVRIEKSLAPIDLSFLSSRLYPVICSSESNTAIVCDPAEIQSMRWLTFEEFFNEYSDKHIGHGLMYLRAHPEILKNIFQQ